nr:MAG TPA: protein of unknown function (DUF5016) [Bacteriophage sp.]
MLINVSIRPIELTKFLSKIFLFLYSLIILFSCSTDVL